MFEDAVQDPDRVANEDARQHGAQFHHAYVRTLYRRLRNRACSRTIARSRECVPNRWWEASMAFS